MEFHQLNARHRGWWRVTFGILRARVSAVRHDMIKKPPEFAAAGGARPRTGSKGARTRTSNSGSRCPVLAELSRPGPQRCLGDLVNAYKPPDGRLSYARAAKPTKLALTGLPCGTRCVFLAWISGEPFHGSWFAIHSVRLWSGPD